MARTASFWFHCRDCSMAGPETFLHSFSASFKETSLKHFQWGISCVRSSNRETTQTVSEGLFSFNFSCSGDAGDFAFSFTIVSNGSSPSAWGKGACFLNDARSYINAFRLLHTAFPVGSIFGISLFTATPFQYPAILFR